MKKRIIAFVLVVVMAAMALVGCGSTVFNYASEDLEPYAEFKPDVFAEALAAIEIEDFDFTTDEAVRAQKVTEQIYNTLTDKVVAVGDKVLNGLIGERDVVYYTYYATTEKDGKTYTLFFDSMEDARLDNTSYKSSHVIELGKTVSSSDELASEFREKLAVALTGKTLSDAYDTDSTKGAALAANQKVVISYKLDVLDASNNKVEAKSGTVTHKVVTLGSDEVHNLLTEIIKADYKNSVGNAATFKDGAKSHTYTDGDGNKFTYSNVIVKWITTSAGEDLGSFSMVRFNKESKVTAINEKGFEEKDFDLKDLTLTYHVFPTSIIHVPEYNATTLIKYILGSSIKADSLEIFEDESYTVEGGTKLPALVEELIKIYAGTTENAKYAAVKTAKEAYDAAKKVVDDKGKNATVAEKKALDDATEALDAAKKTAVDAAIAEILTAASTADGAEPIADAITSEYSEDVRHTLLEKYNTSVIEAVAKKVYAAIEASVEVTDYPEELVKAAYDRLYEAYEYSFYNDKHGAAEEAKSEYSEHKGDFADYLADHTDAKEIDGDIWKGIEKAITEEAKEKLAPVIKIYVVAKALKDDAKDDLTEWAEADNAADRFKVEVERDDYETEEEYNEALTKAEETATKAYENAKKEAERFLVTDEVFNQYKNDVGKASFDSFVETYGEENLRTALQFEKLMNYLTSISTVREDGHNHPKYVERDGVRYLDFRYDGLTYVTVEDADDGTDE